MSKDKKINIHIGTPGAEQTKKDLDGIASSAKGLGGKVNDAGGKGAAGMNKLSKSTGKASTGFGKLKTSVASWALGLVGGLAAIQAITAAIRAQTEAMKENARIAEEHQRKLLRLQHLGGLFRERPELRKEVSALSELGRRPFDEVSDAWYNLRSKGGSLSEGQKESIMKEALEMGRTDPDMPLDTLVDMFSLYAKKSGVEDANRIQNVLQQTITEAGGSGGDVARYMPQFLPIAMAGGLSAPESAGLWAYATTQTSDASIATTGLRAMFMGLEGKGSPESQKIIESLGIGSDMNFFGKLESLSQQKAAGKFGLAQAEQLAGREGASLLLDMLKDPKAMMQTVDRTVSVDRGDIDLTKKSIDDLLGTDEMALLEDNIRQARIEIENIRGNDKDALRWKKYILEKEKRARKLNSSEASIALDRKLYEYAAGAGIPLEAFEAIDATGNKLSDIIWGDDEPSPSESQAGQTPGGSPGTQVVNYNTSYHNDTIINPAVKQSDKGPRFTGK